MKITMISHTPDALELLLFTKSTRLKMTGTSLAEIKAWPQEKKDEELRYMLGTIKSSWEFVDYIFMLEDVTRAFTHQLVRHRAGTAFAQQSQRTVDMTGFSYVATGDLVDEKTADIYDSLMDIIACAYEQMVDSGIRPEDARGALPTNVCTSICFKANLRTLHNICSERLCVKAQGEMQNVVQMMRDAVVEVHPWTEPMLRVGCAFTGICIFPGQKVCPIKGGTFNPETGERWDQLLKRPLTKAEIHKEWEKHLCGSKTRVATTKKQELK